MEMHVTKRRHHQADEDTPHKKIVKQMCNLNTATSKRIPRNVLKIHIKTLNKDDIQKGPEWTFSPIILSGTQEGLSINYYQSKR